MSRRFAALALLLVVATGCASALEEAGEELSPSPSPSPTPPTGASGPATGPTGEPAIVVTSPGSGDEVVSPVSIAGTADVFEVTVNIRILDADGSELAAGFATATCGTGRRGAPGGDEQNCRGEFSTSLAFFTETRQPGAIEVYESSADDGSPIHLVRIPVVLVPGGRR